MLHVMWRSLRLTGRPLFNLSSRFYQRDGYENDDFFSYKRKIDWDMDKLPPRVSLKLPELTSTLSPKDISDYMMQHNIEFSGKTKPILLEKLTDISFTDETDRKLKEQGISKWTPIQAISLPVAMKGQNIVGVAQTGSGKTLSYLLPAISLIQEKQKKGNKGIMSLVLAPTREIVCQISEVAYNILPKGLKVACAYGGVGKAFQLNRLKNASLLVATPGRLFDYLKNEQVSLRSVEMLILDEADHMLDIGFYPQIREIIKFIRPDRQVMMWTATWPSEIRNLSKQLLGNDCVMITIGGRELTCNPDITQMFDYCTRLSDKITKLFDFLNTDQAKVRRILVFCETKSTCDFLTDKLSSNGFKAAAIHGSKTQNYRESLMKSFNKSENDETTRILVASNVAARGLDIAGGVDIVINFDFPQHFEFYVHRIGRTGRAGRKGLSLSFLNSNQVQVVDRISQLLTQAGQEIPKVLKELSSYTGDSDVWQGRRDHSSSFNGNRRFKDDFFSGRGGREFSFNREDRYFNDFSFDRPSRNRKY